MFHILIAIVMLAAGLVLGYCVRPKKTFDGIIEVTPGAKQIFQLEMTVEPEDLTERLRASGKRKETEVLFKVRERRIVEDARS